MFYDIFEGLCKRANTTPAQVRKDLGISQSTMASWKSRGLTPKSGTLKQLADYFGVSMSFLLGWISAQSRLQNAGLSVDDVAAEVGISKEIVEQMAKISDAEEIDEISKIIHAAIVLADTEAKDPPVANPRGLSKSYERMSANDAGMEKAAPSEKERISLEESNHLLVALGFIEEGQDLSDDDLAFLANITQQLDLWFSNRHKRPETAPQSPPTPQEGTDTTTPLSAPESK